MLQCGTQRRHELKVKAGETTTRFGDARNAPPSSLKLRAPFEDLASAEALTRPAGRTGEAALVAQLCTLFCRVADGGRVSMGSARNGTVAVLVALCPAGISAAHAEGKGFGASPARGH